MVPTTMKTIIPFTITIMATVSLVAAAFSGNQVITPEDYPVFGPAAVNNPPFCGMPYAELDLDRITAVEVMSQGECGTCLKVSNSDDPSKSVFVLAVDRGGRGLDLSTGAFQLLFGQNQTPASAKWETVASSNCGGIWKNAPNKGGDPGAPPPPPPPPPPPLSPTQPSNQTQTTTPTRSPTTSPKKNTRPKMEPSLGFATIVLTEETPTPTPIPTQVSSSSEPAASNTPANDLNGDGDPEVKAQSYSSASKLPRSMSTLGVLVSTLLMAVLML